MTITEYARYVLDHPETVEETPASMAVTQRLDAYRPNDGTPPAIDPEAEENYWSRNYAGQPYVRPGEEYSRFRAAYRFGWLSRDRFIDRNWVDVATQLQKEWESDPANFDFPWTRARPAVRDAWDRLTVR